MASLVPTSLPSDASMDQPWERYRYEIWHLYIRKNMKLGLVKKEMQRRHGFFASDFQYETKLKEWGFFKNLKQEEWRDLVRRIQMRLPKRTNVVLGGIHLPPAKVQKAIKRYSYQTTLEKINNANRRETDSSGCSRALLVTPPPTSVHMSSSWDSPCATFMKEQRDDVDHLAQMFPDLQAAVISGCMAVVKLHLDKGAYCDAPGAEKGGRTALEAAAERGRLDILELLISYGARIEGPGQIQYFRAIYFAEHEERDAVTRYLKTKREWTTVDERLYEFYRSVDYRKMNEGFDLDITSLYEGSDGIPWDDFVNFPSDDEVEML